jgi:glycosyltransferase involved in cell wall biosynthesis
MSGPLVSIVLPTLNGSRFIQQSIESCLRQSYTNLEVIVVDGGSTDGTLDIVAGLADGRVRVIPQPANSGRLPGALNLGFAQARGEYFTWTQDDDWYEPTAIEYLARHLMEHPEVGLAYASFAFVDEAGQFVRDSTLGPPEALYWTNCVGHCFLYRRAVAAQVGEYALDYVMAEDAQYWMRIYKVAPLAFLPGRFFNHRLHAGNLTGRGYGAYESLRVAARARREVLGISWREFQRQVAAADIEEAFATFADGAWDRSRRCLARGLVRDPRWLRNRGVLSLAAEAVVGRRWMSRWRGRHVPAETPRVQSN